jgi:hypothetical protein
MRRISNKTIATVIIFVALVVIVLALLSQVHTS